MRYHSKSIGAKGIHYQFTDTVHIQIHRFTLFRIVNTVIIKMIIVQVMQISIHHEIIVAIMLHYLMSTVWIQKVIDSGMTSTFAVLILTGRANSTN